MTPESPKNNNVYLVAIITGVFGIVGAIIGVTGNFTMEKLKHEYALTEVALVDIVTQSAATQESMASTFYSPTNIPTIDTPLPTEGSSNPVGIVPSNMPINVDNLSLGVQGLTVKESDGHTNIHLELYVKNIGDRTRIFRYTGANVTLRDDLGNTYPPYFPPDCDQTSLNDARQFNLDIGQKQRVLSIPSMCFYTNGGESYLQQFMGPIAQNANSLVIGFTGFGPFTGFEIEVKP